MAQSVEGLTDSGHDLTVPEFEPHVGLCADSLEAGAYFGFCVSLSLSPLPHFHSVCLSLTNKHYKHLKEEGKGSVSGDGRQGRNRLKGSSLSCFPDEKVLIMNKS